MFILSFIIFIIIIITFITCKLPFVDYSGLQNSNNDLNNIDDEPNNNEINTELTDNNETEEKIKEN